MGDVRARLIDANLNRAREGLRVLEDLARFGLADAGLSATLKRLRHGLGETAAAVGLDRAHLLAWRDTPGDVGTEISVASEGHRASLAEVALVAGARVTEALRVIEECAKVRDRTDAEIGRGAAFEALRYDVYEAQRRVVAALGGGRARQWRLCVLLTAERCRLPWERVAAEALRGGADCLQLREKTLPGAELLERARRLVALARGFDGASPPAVIVNDRPDIAVLAQADGVHVGQADLPVREVRRLAGASLLVGVSTADPGQAEAAVGAGADYCGVGPMFISTTTDKPVTRGPEYLRQYLADPRTRRVPHLAIGGVTPENVGVLAALGCRGVAVGAAVCQADDPAGVCARLAAALGEETPGSAEPADRPSGGARGAG
ncbi:MAG TPA: thiamine phosphate synthase [Phycisphaerales bacterium]|nr:thiamine phosphate synthase [Phycisphaerales bacterium]